MVHGVEERYVGLLLEIRRQIRVCEQLLAELQAQETTP